MKSLTSLRFISRAGIHSKPLSQPFLKLSTLTITNRARFSISAHQKSQEAGSSVPELDKSQKDVTGSQVGTVKRLPEFSLQDKVVCVSGAARGLGLVQAEALLEAGATGELALTVQTENERIPSCLGFIQYLLTVSHSLRLGSPPGTLARI